VAHALFVELRELEARAVARRTALGRPCSRRALAQEAGGGDLAKRVADWVPSRKLEAAPRLPQNWEPLWVVVQIWTKWAGEASRESHWKLLYEAARHERNSRDRVEAVPGPRIWGEVPPRNPSFVGRDALLERLRRDLCDPGSVAVRALHGLAGVGKSSMAAEYAHRYRADFDVVWWIDAEQNALVSEQMVTLGVTAGVIDQWDETAHAVRTSVDWLRRRRRWLLIFDNATEHSDLAQFLPGDGGQVLITSRNPRWEEIAVGQDIGLFSRTESIALLRRFVSDLGDDSASAVAEVLGDLPIAVTQAARFLADTGIPPAEYQADLERGRSQEGLSTLAAAVRLSYRRLDRSDPAATALMRLCAVLGPAPIRLSWLAQALDTGSASGMGQIFQPLAKLGLARASSVPGWIVVHRAIQATVRAMLTPQEYEEERRRAEQMVVAVPLGPPDDPGSWPDWANVLPHLLAADSARSGDTYLREKVCDGVSYVLLRGDTRASLALAERLRGLWVERFGVGDQHVLKVAHLLSTAYYHDGQYEAALALDQENFDRRRAILGPDHPDTLMSANGLAVTLGSLGRNVEARDLHLDTLERLTRTLGADHHQTLRTAYNLAGQFRALGDLESARRLGEDTLARRRKGLPDYPLQEMSAAHSLAITYSRIRDYPAAQALHEDIRRRRIEQLGEDHPASLRSGHSLGDTLRDMGETESAREILSDVLQRRERILGLDHPATTETRLMLEHLGDPPRCERDRA
jgi:Tetratricopeptide repeat/NB-ARC domain